MEQKYDLDRTIDLANRANVNFLQEKEKFLNNVEAIRRTSHDVSVLTCELEKIIAELVLTRQDLGTLQTKVRIMAEQFGI
jgi:hypothetical protein